MFFSEVFYLEEVLYLELFSLLWPIMEELSKGTCYLLPGVFSTILTEKALQTQVIGNMICTVRHWQTENQTDILLLKVDILSL